MGEALQRSDNSRAGVNGIAREHTVWPGPYSIWYTRCRIVRTYVGVCVTRNHRNSICTEMVGGK